MSDADLLDWLCSWYAEQCDSEWEHSYGVSIDTLDNPGWRVRIDLVGTVLEHVRVPRDGRDDGQMWWQCWTEGGAYHAACSPDALPVVLNGFRRLATRGVR